MLECQRRGFREKLFFPRGEDGEAESLLVYILVSLCWRSVTLKNVDMREFKFISVHIQFSLLYLKKGPATCMCGLFKLDSEKR